METKNLVSSLQILNAKHAVKLSTSGTAVQRLASLTGAGVAPGTAVLDTVTGQKVEVISAGVAYVSEEVLSEVPTVRK